MRFEQIVDYLEETKPEVILEVGTWNGGTARMFIKAAKAKRYIGFDIWEDGTKDLDEIEFNVKKRATKEEAEKNLQNTGAEIELIQGNTRETLPEYVKNKKPFVDVAFIDGGHSVGTIKSDLINAIAIVKPSGKVFIDDYYFHSDKKGVGANNVLGDMSIPFTILPAADRAIDGSIVKVARIDVKDCPRLNWDEDATLGWKFDPAA